jgi:hypothetical protein
MFGIDFYDAVLLTGKFQEEELRTLESLRNLKSKEVQVVGATFLDTAYSRRLTNKEDKSDQKEKFTVLVAPTWGPEAILSKFGSEFLSKLKESPYEIIIRPHPQSRISEPEVLERLTGEFPESENWHWNYDNDNFDVLNKSDIMITDFSGIIFEYALLFDRPVIYTSAQIDYSVYDSCWIEEPSWRQKILSEIGVEMKMENIGDISSIIRDAMSSDSMQKGRQKAALEAWMNRGHAAEATADYLIQKLEQLKKEEKINA